MPLNNDSVDSLISQDCSAGNVNTVMESVDFCVLEDEDSKSRGKIVGRQKQERYGIKLVNKQFKFQHILVVASCWPSILWSLNLKSINTNFCLYMFNVKEELMEEVRAHFESVEMVGVEAAEKMMSDIECFVIGQGNVNHLWELWLKLGIPILTHGILLCHFDRLLGKQFGSHRVRWMRFKHAKLGGLTAKVYLVGIPDQMWRSELLKSISNINLSRTLLDILDHGGVGKMVDPPLHNGHLASWDLTNQAGMYVCPSYRVASGWVSRKLTFKECALCLDINELIIKRVEQSSSQLLKHRIMKGDIIPGKLCQVLAEWMHLLWSEEKPQNQTSNVEHVCSSKDSSVVELDSEDKVYLDFEQKYLISYGEKAAKNDDDEVPVELWDRAVLRHRFKWLEYSPKVKHALKIIRNNIGFRWYLNRLRKSYFRYLKETYGKQWWTLLGAIKGLKVGTKRKRDYDMLINFGKDIKVGQDGIARAAGSSWWEWKKGSSCFFWRWPKEIRDQVRDGFPVHVEGSLPTYRQRQVFHLKDDEFKQLTKKIQKVIDRGYLEQGYVHSLINYFAVPKGEGDIRIVYDGTKCGLNSVVWAPNFFLPSIDSLAMFTSNRTWFADLDLGEMFLNYFIDDKLRPYCGVDVSKLGEQGCNKWVRWNRTLMGFRSSPYIAVKMFGWTLDMVRGNKNDLNNPFRWNRIRLNLPGSDGYNPMIPWVCKMWNNEEASDAKPYVDDIRVHGSTEEGTRKATRRTSSVTQYLGEQNADRKKRPPSLVPGPWCGSFFAVKDGSVFVYVSQAKWMKAKHYLISWLEQVQLGGIKTQLDFKDLEKGRGFLVYLSRTYPAITPFLKGIHLTLDSWREGRDDDGWKLSKKMRKEKFKDFYEDKEYYYDKEDDVEDKNLKAQLNGKPPKKVCPVTRLLDDLVVLNDFFSPDMAPWRFVRGNKISMVRYGFGDASKSGFGSTIEVENGVAFRYGLWSTEGQEESSNFRELENLAETLEKEAELRTLHGNEIFLLTDNSTSELAFYKGTSSSRKLFEIVVRLRQLEMHHRCKIHFIHVAGTRMIAQGTDGLSRGDLGEGVMKGRSMLSFVPLHLSAAERSPSILGWVKGWITPCLKSGEVIEILTEADWFWRAHDIDGGFINPDGLWTPKYRTGLFVWFPAPASGQVAVEQLREARNKRTQSLHVIIIPRMFSCLWRRQLLRVADISFELPFIDQIWSKEEQHEPLTIAFVFPFLNHSPWQLRRAPAFLEMARVMSRVWKEDNLAPGCVLCKLLSSTRALGAMSKELVRRVLLSSRSFGVCYTEATE